MASISWIKGSKEGGSSGSCSPNVVVYVLVGGFRAFSRILG